MVKTKSSAGRGPPPAGLRVESVANLARHMAGALRAACGLKHCQPYSVQQQSGRTKYTFEGSGPTINGLRLAQIHESRLSIYWIGMAMEMEQAPLHGDILRHLSIALFGGGSPGTSIPIFRAEWDPRDTTTHAQPHWNLEPGILAGARHERFDPEAETRGRWMPDTAQNSEGDTEPTAPLCLNNLHKFHFAMGAGWPVGDGHSSQAMTEDALPRWVAGCVSYIRGEVIFIDL